MSSLARGGAVLLGAALLAVPTVWSLVTDPAPTTHRLISTTPPVYAVVPSAAAPQAAAPAAGVEDVDPAWVARTAARAGIPATAVRAYGRAVLAEGRADPGCAIGWTTLAGIGWVESQHGTIGGRTLLPTGYSSAPITGPALSGGLDRAYGPMQFIPDTWARYATDGDGDGSADPNDIFDAAVATAAYLCADGYDLANSSGWAQAIFSYNHSQDYVNQVDAAAIAYDQRTR
ncbi:hypothetical protein GCM10028801_35510 [Nocardioides maradonensis]